MTWPFAWHNEGRDSIALYEFSQCYFFLIYITKSAYPFFQKSNILLGQGPNIRFYVVRKYSKICLIRGFCRTKVSIWRGSAGKIMEIVLGILRNAQDLLLFFFCRTRCHISYMVYRRIIEFGRVRSKSLMLWYGWRRRRLSRCFGQWGVC